MLELYATQPRQKPFDFEDFFYDRPSQAIPNPSALVNDIYPSKNDSKCLLTMSAYAIVLGKPRFLRSMLHTAAGEINTDIDLYYCGQQKPIWDKVLESVCLSVDLSLILLKYQNAKKIERLPYNQCFYYVDKEAKESHPCIFDDSKKIAADASFEIAITINDLENTRSYQALSQLYHYLTELESESLTGYRAFRQISEHYLYQAIYRGDLTGFCSVYTEQVLNEEYTKKEPKNTAIDWNAILDYVRSFRTPIQDSNNLLSLDCSSTLMFPKHTLLSSQSPTPNSI